MGMPPQVRLQHSPFQHWTFSEKIVAQMGGGMQQQQMMGGGMPPQMVMAPMGMVRDLLIDQSSAGMYIRDLLIDGHRQRTPDDKTHSSFFAFSRRSDHSCLCSLVLVYQ